MVGSMKEINKTSKYFKYTDTSIIFIGNELKVYVPKSYIDAKLCTLGDVITPDSIDTSSDEDYIICTFTKNSTFVKNRNIVHSTDMLYTMFNSFISLKRLPSFITYDNVYKLFNKLKEANGQSLNVDNKIYECMWSHLARDHDDTRQQYRHGKMTKSPIFLGMSSVGVIPTSTTAKIGGTNMETGIVGAILDESNDKDVIEEILIK